MRSFMISSILCVVSSVITGAKKVSKLFLLEFIPNYDLKLVHIIFGVISKPSQMFDSMLNK